MPRHIAPHSLIYRFTKQTAYNIARGVTAFLLDLTRTFKICADNTTEDRLNELTTNINELGKTIYDLDEIPIR